MISSGSHCVATLICKEVKDKVSLEYLGESIGKGLSDKKLGWRKRKREDVGGAKFRGSTQN